MKRNLELLTLLVRLGAFVRDTAGDVIQEGFGRANALDVNATFRWDCVGCAVFLQGPTLLAACFQRIWRSGGLEAGAYRAVRQVIQTLSSSHRQQSCQNNRDLRELHGWGLGMDWGILRKSTVGNIPQE